MHHFSDSEKRIAAELTEKSSWKQKTEYYKPTHWRGRKGVDVPRSDLDKLPTDCTNNSGIKKLQAGPPNRISWAYGCVCAYEREYKREN